jgi:hypothetical protein
MPIAATRVVVFDESIIYIVRRVVGPHCNDLIIRLSLHPPFMYAWVQKNLWSIKQQLLYRRRCLDELQHKSQHMLVFGIPCSAKSGNLWQIEVELRKNGKTLQGNPRINISIFYSNFPIVKQTILCLIRGNSSFSWWSHRVS